MTVELLQITEDMPQGIRLGLVQNWNSSARRRVTAERIIVDEAQTLRNEVAVSPAYPIYEYHTVQYLERFDRSGRRIGFQPKLGSDVIPVCFGTIKGARAAARRKWGRVR